MAKKLKPPGWVSQRVGMVTVKMLDDDRVGIAIRKDGIFEPETLDVWAAACLDGRAQTAIDVGAHNGLFAISAALLGNNAIAIEGKRELVDRIHVNAIANRAEITVTHAAASNHDGEGIFHMNGCVLSCASSLLHRPDKHNRSITIKTIKLDSLSGIKGKVGALKIDVEGSEAEVLEGALELINNDRPVLLVETLEYDDRKRRVRELLPNYECVGFLDRRNMHMVHRDAVDHV